MQLADVGGQARVHAVDSHHGQIIVDIRRTVHAGQKAGDAAQVEPRQRQRGAVVKPKRVAQPATRRDTTAGGVPGVLGGAHKSP